MDKIKTFIRQFVCGHRRKKKIYLHHQEGYVEFKCRDCGKMIYKPIKKQEEK